MSKWLPQNMPAVQSLSKALINKQALQCLLKTFNKRAPLNSLGHPFHRLIALMEKAWGLADAMKATLSGRTASGWKSVDHS